MTLHLHFLDSRGPNDRPKLVMTQFWRKAGDLEPVTVTFGDFHLGLPMGRTKSDAKAFCQLILLGKPIEGDLATSLWEVARKKVKGQPNAIEVELAKNLLEVVRKKGQEHAKDSEGQLAKNLLEVARKKVRWHVKDLEAELAAILLEVAQKEVQEHPKDIEGKLTQNLLEVAWKKVQGHEKGIGGDLAKNVLEGARKVVEGKPNYLQMLFGLEADQEIPEQWLLCKREICHIGADLEAATIQCFLHQKVSAAQGAYRPVEKKRPSGPGARSRSTPLRPLDKEECRNLASRMLGGVRITEVTIHVRKNNVGELKDGNAKGVLPLNSKDTFELKVTCDKPAYLYVFWFGSSGKRAAPIFPWAYNKGWADSKATERDQPRENLVLTNAYRTDLPEQLRQFRSVGHPGAELLVVLAHIVPLKREVLQSHFKAFPKEKPEPLGWRTETELENMPLETGLVSETADPDGAPDPEEDALDRVASWIGRLQMYVDDVKGLVIPTVGGE